MKPQRSKNDLSGWGGGDENEPRTERRIRREAWPWLRDVILFFTGLGGVLHETIIRTAERPSLLLLFAAMMGLPAFLRRDSKASE